MPTRSPSSFSITCAIHIHTHINKITSLPPPTHHPPTTTQPAAAGATGSSSLRVTAVEVAWAAEHLVNGCLLEGLAHVQAQARGLVQVGGCVVMRCVGGGGGRSSSSSFAFSHPPFMFLPFDPPPQEGDAAAAAALEQSLRAQTHRLLAQVSAYVRGVVRVLGR